MRGGKSYIKRQCLNFALTNCDGEIDDAEEAIRQRIVELKQSASSSEEERRAIEDALRGLRALAITECKPPLSTSSGLAPLP